MAFPITESVLTDWLEAIGLDSENVASLSTQERDIMESEEYKEFSYKLVQKFIAKARFDLSEANFDPSPTSLSFQINCTIDFSDDGKTAGVILGCCGSGGGSNCVPCVKFFVPVHPILD